MQTNSLKVNCNGVSYILKGYKIDFGKVIFENKIIENRYKNYFALKAASNFEPYFVKALFMNYAIEVTTKGSRYILRYSLKI